MLGGRREFRRSYIVKYIGRMSLIFAMILLTSYTLSIKIIYEIEYYNHYSIMPRPVNSESFFFNFFKVFH